VVSTRELVSWVRCIVCKRTYINLPEARLGGCGKWSRSLSENGEFLESEYPYDTMASILKMGRFPEAAGGPRGGAE
jgi:hypothetical protein